jgi:peptide/nickel transport system permease protein
VETPSEAPTSVAGDRIWRAVLRSTEGRVGVSLGAIMLAVVLFGRFAAPYGPTAIAVGPPSSGPTAAHLLGTDSLGRDTLSRFLYGGLSIFVAPALAVVIAYLIGTPLGIVAGYRRGAYDAVLNRLFDLLLTLPPFLLILVLIAGLGTSREVLVGTVALVFVPRIGRVVRAATLGVVTNDYVAAAEARGERGAYIVAREILPNIVEPLIVDFSLRLTYSIIFVSSLNFLGLGVQPPNPDWGVMVAEGRSIITVAPLAAFAPAAGIAALSISFNLIADAMGRHLSRAAR